jgi:hypothetical protein
MPAHSFARAVVDTRSRNFVMSLLRLLGWRDHFATVQRIEGWRMPRSFFNFRRTLTLDINEAGLELSFAEAAYLDAFDAIPAIVLDMPNGVGIFESALSRFSTKGPEDFRLAFYGGVLSRSPQVRAPKVRPVRIADDLTQIEAVSALTSCGFELDAGEKCASTLV